MKVSTKDIGCETGITELVKDTVGQEYETISDLAGTVQFDRLTDDEIDVIQQKYGALTLKTVMLP